MKKTFNDFYNSRVGQYLIYGFIYVAFWKLFGFEFAIIMCTTVILGEMHFLQRISSKITKGGKLKIYLAGPDVFLPNATEVGNMKKNICDKYGFIGLFPFDNEVDAIGKSPSEIGHAISKANEDMIRDCDIILANLTPFRGPSADVGTVYELGFARGLGKKCYGYSNVSTMFNHRVKEFFGIDSEENTDHNGMTIENFDLRDNLMIPCGIMSSGGFVITTDCDDIFSDLTIFEFCISQIKI